MAPFHSHSQQGANPAQGIFNAAAALGKSIGAPRLAGNQGQTTAGTDLLLQSGGQLIPGGGHTAPPASGGLQGPGTLPSSNPSYDRRAPNAMGRAESELHISAASSSQPPQQQQMYNSPGEFGPGPNVNHQQAMPQGSQYSTPSALQAGQQRPVPSSSAHASYTSTGPQINAAPPIPQINTNAQQYSLPTRTNTNQSTSHTYSRSSPAGLGPDQKYVPFSNTPENPKYTAGTPAQKYYPSTPSGAASNSPLGLDDIRPRANSSMNEDPLGVGKFFNDSDRVPSNSNYLAPWGAYAFDWCKWSVPGGNSAGKMAVGSYLEDTHNFIQILDTHITPQEVTTPGAPPFGLEYSRIAEATCSYPVTRILWEPPSSQKQSTDLLATSGDHLRLWSLPQSTPANVSSTITRTSSVNTREPPPQKLTPLALLSNSKTPEHTAPLTSLDWNTMSPKLIITSSIDTTCTIWDIPTLTAKTQLIAHDKEVFDVRFCAGSVDVFVSCGADGSVRMFDLRSLEHSTIIYEPSERAPGDRDKGSPAGRMSPTKAQQTMSYAPPLLRLAASPHDSHLLATFAADSSIIRILDVRQPGQALLELRGHSASVNAIEWNPARRGMLASGGDDSLVLVWDLLNSQNGAVINEETHPTAPKPPPSTQPTNGGQQTTTATAGQKGPYASWRCEYEVSNLSWAPQSALTGQGGEWVGVSGGRGVWGVKL
ncbi:WD40 repeat-like protein [Amniculicola lignicola CBS 123094]|uniref:WD40 repeat-like protein n=1 Tax=Amniculicola lignicola CBS 123094 TaxID=1392246 RepID=A0A6A5X3A0_9PLEO|nr:WD40 repeat-like protein [Amniculicola lignicola CBS 123094]